MVGSEREKGRERERKREHWYTFTSSSVANNSNNCGNCKENLTDCSQVVAGVENGLQVCRLADSLQANVSLNIQNRRVQPAASLLPKSFVFSLVVLIENESANKRHKRWPPMLPQQPV